MPDDTDLREQLIELLQGGNAHATLDDALNDFPPGLVGVRPEGSPHSPWELVEHLRIALEDILRFSQSDQHVSPPWPRGYWPSSPEPGPGQWDATVAAVRRDLAEFAAMVRDPEQDLVRKFPWGEGQTLLREALLIADHNAYHVGQLVLVRRLLGAWE